MGEVRRDRRVLIVALLEAVLSGVSPMAALVQSTLLAALPGPGDGLAAPPSNVVLRFDEPLSQRLSQITVADTAGADVDAGPTTAVPGDAAGMQRRLAPLPTGVYTVSWMSVSADDGHALHGRYQFGVRASVPGGATSAPEPSANPVGGDRK